MGHGGIGICQCVLLSVILILFLVPLQKADAIFILSEEPSEEKLTKEELFELTRKEQILLAEKMRDYIFEFRPSIQNPYLDIINKDEGNKKIFQNNISLIIQESNIEQNKIEQIALA